MSDLEFLADRWNCTPERVIARLVSTRAQEERDNDARLERIRRRKLYNVGEAWEALVTTRGKTRIVRREIVQVYRSLGRRGSHDKYSEVTFKQEAELFQRSVSWTAFDNWARRHGATLVNGSR